MCSTGMDNTGAAGNDIQQWAILQQQILSKCGHHSDSHRLSLTHTGREREGQRERERERERERVHNCACF